MDDSIFASLIESKAELQVEMRYIKSGIDKILDTLDKIDTRIARIERVIEFKEKSLFSTLLEVFWQYKHMIAFYLTIASFIAGIFFNVKFKGIY